MFWRSVPTSHGSGGRSVGDEDRSSRMGTSELSSSRRSDLQGSGSVPSGVLCWFWFCVGSGSGSVFGSPSPTPADLEVVGPRPFLSTKQRPLVDKRRDVNE
ncbi:hypothetical protein EYF80_040422 [Liparis tanakae]|uniref:Uncharacterized protein n=1 Tax=Liparis tanakae TaxID=230148 RepID=A0A4Z2G817_9TELE|nr:hypothetical protein EYF80_040422 [Liparis tanakae]